MDKPNGQNGSSLDQQILQKKAQVFEQEFVELQRKHGIAVVPALQYTDFGIIPTLLYQDKRKIDEMNAKMTGDLARAGQAKPVIDK